MLLKHRRLLMQMGGGKDVRAVCFQADGDQTVSITASGSAPTLTMQYSYNGRSWRDWDLSALSFGGSKKVYVRGVGNTRFASSTSAYNSFTFGTDALVYASGIVETLLDWESEISSYSATYVFYRLFYGQTALCSAKGLIFSSSNITGYAYHSMFYGCTSLLDCPESLPSTLTGSFNCPRMFYNCSSLTAAPELPATTAKYSCYYGMFYNCSSLTAAPALPATTLENNCYWGMFYNCSSLTTAPELPATTLAYYCYKDMFYNCTSLTTAPELPATTLEDRCYDSMFYNCSSLTTAPVLPATTLAAECYEHMFTSCTSLTAAPELPATTLADYCYRYMFHDCTSLISAPELPATTLAEECYYNMFCLCRALKSITCRAKITANQATRDWLESASSTGTFYGYSEYGWESGESGIPSGWTFVELTD